jgi:hypothetical protein
LDHPFYLAMVIAVFCSFGCVLGFVSFEETRTRRKASAKIGHSHPEKASGEIVFSK